MEEFNSGFMTPVPITAEPAPGSAGTQQSGRLYRSSGAEGPAAETAIPAMDSGLVRISTDPTAQPAAAYRSATSQSPDAPDRSGSTFAAAGIGFTDEEPADSVEAPAASARHSFRVSAQPTGLTYNGAAVVILAATIVVGFIDAILNHKLGWLTGVALVASAVYAALNVRIADAWAPAILAPLGFMAATLTAGQLTRGSSGSWFIREGYMIFRSLAVNAPWIIGATVICAGIAFWRKRSA
jgi:hypothetical protein